MQRLAEAQAALAASQAGMASLQGEVKRAFMRGVCALNIEAMGLLRGGGGGGGGAGGGAGPAAGAAPGEQQAAATAAGAMQGGPEAGAGGDSPAGQSQMQKLLRKAAGATVQDGAPAPWSIAVPALPPVASAQLQHPLQHPRTASPLPSSVQARPMPAAEQPHPLVTMETRLRVPVLPAPPGGHRRAERHTSSGNSVPGTDLAARPATAVPCSLPTHVPAHLRAALAVRGSASPAPPATAPPRRAAAAAERPAPQQVSRRSLAGQQRGMGGGGGAGGGQVVVVRGPGPVDRH